MKIIGWKGGMMSKQSNDILEQLISLMRSELDEQEYANYINKVISISFKFVSEMNNEKSVRLKKILKEI